MTKEEKLCKDNAYLYIKNLVKNYKLESYCFDDESEIEIEQGYSEMVYQKQIDFILLLFKEQMSKYAISQYEFTFEGIGTINLQA